MVFVLVTAMAALSSCSGDDGGDADHAPELAAPDETGRELAHEFLTILHDGDIDELRNSWPTGSSSSESTAPGPPRPSTSRTLRRSTKFMLGPTFIAVQQDDVLTVRWTVTVESVINGQPAGTAEAPRLSSFVWDEGRWRLLSHANFNALSN